MSKYSRKKRPYFFKKHPFEETSEAATVYHLRAFADAIGADTASLRRTLAVERGPSRPRTHCKGWAFAYPEEIDESKELGGHRYMVYGRWQDEPPTEEQLDNPPEKLVRPTPVVNVPSHRLWCVDPDYSLYIVWGVAAFARQCDFDARNLNKQKKLLQEDPDFTRHWFVPRGTRVNATRTVVGWDTYVDKSNPVRGDARHDGGRGYLQKIRPIYMKRGEPKGPHMWRIVNLGKLIEVAKSGDLFHTVIHGEVFVGKPDDTDLERLGVKWDDLFPWHAWKYFELGKKTSGKVE